MAKLDPTEECWRQLRSALGNRYFGSLEGLRVGIRPALETIQLKSINISVDEYSRSIELADLVKQPEKIILICFIFLREETCQKRSDNVTRSRSTNGTRYCQQTVGSDTKYPPLGKTFIQK